MKQLILLLVLLGSWAAQAANFDTVHEPGKHNAVVVFQCDDRVDSQFVNVANYHGIKINFAPYKVGGTTIIDYDSLYAKGEYTQSIITWAEGQGMTFATHASAQSPALVDTFGIDSLKNVFDSEGQWLRSRLATSQKENVLGHVWTGHVNNPITRAFAKDYGYTYTRGGWGNSKDIYLSAHGWLSPSGASAFYPTAMNHRALLPSCSMYRLTNGALADSLYQLSTVADTTNLWRGTLDFLNTLANRNGFAVLNIHPGWGGPHAETEADTLTESWAVITNTFAGSADSIRFNSRKGATTRNDVSAYQLDYILNAMEWWSDSVKDADGVSSLCIAEINQLVKGSSANWRNDNSSNWRSVSDWVTPASGTPTYAYWESNDGLYAKDPALDRARTVYVDGTGTVNAGNGTRQFPLPTRTWPYLFNCTVEFINHSAGDNYEGVAGQTVYTGNVTYNLNGLDMVESDSTDSIIEYDDSDGYAKNVTWKNGGFKYASVKPHDDIPAIYLGKGQAFPDDSLSIEDFTLYGVTIDSTNTGLSSSATKNLVIDSCYIYTTDFDATDVSYALFLTTTTKNPLIRNSYISGEKADEGWYAIDTGGSTADDIADSARVINNILVVGAGSGGTQYLFRAASDSSAATYWKWRFDGNYYINNESSDDIMRDIGGSRNITVAEWMAHLATAEPTFAPVRQVAFPGSYAAFSVGTTVNDTIRYDGYTGAGSVQTTGYASIGPTKYSFQPRLGTDFATQYNVYAGPSAYFEALIETGIVAVPDTLELDFSIPHQLAQYEHWLTGDWRDNHHSSHVDSLFIIPKVN